MFYPNYFHQLKKAIPLLMQESGIPGLSISVCDKEKVVFADTYGFTDLSKTIPVDEKTQFAMMSISKTYTAFGFMLAVQDNKIALDDPVKKFMPDFSVRHKDGEDYSPVITFRQCLTHYTGLRHEPPIGNNWEPYNGTFDEHINSINGTFLRFKPGEQFSYSNMGIDIAAYALGKIYDMPFEDYMQEKVFIPLEMNNSTFNQDKFITRTDTAIGHAYKKSLEKNPVKVLGAGGMYSCPDDMTHFIRCILNKGIYNGRQIIKQDILEQMYSKYPESDEWQYNLGVNVGFIKKRAILNHCGGGYGFLTAQDIVLGGGLGAAIVTNAVLHDKYIQICRNIWDDIFDLQDAGKTDCEPVSDNYESFFGVYEATTEGVTFKKAVVPRNGAIYCGNQKLEHYSGNLYFNENNDTIEFAKDGIICDNIMFRRCSD